MKENAQNKKSKDTSECRYFKQPSHRRNKIHYTNKQRLYPQSQIHTLLYTKPTINKITLYADSSTYISTIYCAAFHLFSAQLALAGFSTQLVSLLSILFPLIGNSITVKKGTKVLSTVSILSPFRF